MATEHAGLKRRSATVRTVVTALDGDLPVREQVRAGLKVVGVGSTAVVAASEFAVNAHAATVGLLDFTAPGLVTASIAGPFAALVTFMGRSDEKQYEGFAKQYEGVGYMADMARGYADKASHIRRASRSNSRRIAAACAVVSGVAVATATALAGGPDIGLGHADGAARGLIDVAEVFGAGSLTAMANANYWGRRIAATEPAPRAALNE